MKRWLKWISTTALFLTLLCAIPAPGQERSGQRLFKLSKLGPEQRQQALVEGARAEKEVTFYSSLQAQQIEPFAQAFNKRFPFLKVNTYRVSGNKLLVKIQTEYKAGKHLVDVVNVSAEEAAALKKIGTIDPYLSPQREFFPASAKDKEGYFTAFSLLTQVLGYNTNGVKRAEAPRSYYDLLQPKWKGNMFLDNEAYDWFTVLLRHFGREKGLHYMRNLAKQDLTMMRGRTAQTQLLAAGERPIAIVQSGNTVLDYKAKGAPIDIVVMEPYLALANYIMLARYAPHPYAAALFIDWSLSEEGEAMATTFGRVVARKGVKQRFPELLEKEPFVVDADFIAPMVEEGGREFRDIFLGGR